jgi:hypothetical protein
MPSALCLAVPAVCLCLSLVLLSAISTSTKVRPMHRAADGNEIAAPAIAAGFCGVIRSAYRGVAPQRNTVPLRPYDLTIRPNVCCSDRAAFRSLAGVRIWPLDHNHSVWGA